MRPATTHTTNSLNAFSAYRFHFNGKETDNEVYGEGNVYDYGFRIYNPRIGKFLSVDPLTSSYPFYTPYQFSGNSPIENIDLDGLEPLKNGLVTKAMREGKTTLTFPNSNKILQPISPKNVSKVTPTNKVETPTPPTPTTPPSPALVTSHTPSTPQPEPSKIVSGGLALKASYVYAGTQGSAGPGIIAARNGIGAEFSGDVSANIPKPTAGVGLAGEASITFSNNSTVESGFSQTYKVSTTSSFNIFGTGITYKSELDLTSGDRTYTLGIQIGLSNVVDFSSTVSASKGFSGKSITPYSDFKAENFRIPSSY